LNQVAITTFAGFFKEYMDRKKALLPVLVSAALALGLLLGYRIQGQLNNTSLLRVYGGSSSPIEEVINLVNAKYVDEVEKDKLYGDAISKMMENLDPHSLYISNEELKSVEEEMSGNFEGIGIEFSIVNDTIQVVTPLSGGPSEQLGIQAGDKIVMIDDTLVAGIGITNIEVMRKLKGPKATKVKVSVRRGQNDKLIHYTITRDKIPLYSVDAGFMLDDKTGYIKINRFSAQTYQEFMDKALPLKKLGMQQLVLDLRQNPGGYLGEAIKLVDEFLDSKKEIVYTEGRNFPKEYYKAGKLGDFETTPIAILIDEGSASASEIIAGAIQDWDRGVIIGRRSFGKGLVQEQFQLKNGAAVRLTVAKYYTPSGRSIQKSYENGRSAYDEDLVARYENGEIYHRDSIHNDKSLEYKTKLLKRTVYGGGGITPDIFIAMDTSYFNPLVNEILISGLITQFTYDYYASNKQEFSAYKSFKDFAVRYNISDDLYKRFIDFTISRGVSPAHQTYAAASRNELTRRIKALLAKQIWKNDGMYYILMIQDEAVQRAVKELSRNTRLEALK
jgi:carboxyl-terminal processing protease